jgi:hypothetical protein
MPATLIVPALPLPAALRRHRGQLRARLGVTVAICTRLEDFTAALIFTCGAPRIARRTSFYCERDRTYSDYQFLVVRPLIWAVERIVRQGAGLRCC